MNGPGLIKFCGCLPSEKGEPILGIRWRMNELRKTNRNKMIPHEFRKKNRSTVASPLAPTWEPPAAALLVKLRAPSVGRSVMGRNIRFILPNCRFIWIPGLGLLLFDDAAAAAADDDDDDGNEERRQPGRVLKSPYTLQCESIQSRLRSISEGFSWSIHFTLASAEP